MSERSMPDPVNAEAGSRIDAVERLRRLQLVTDATLAHLSVDELLEQLLLRIREILDADTAAVLLLDPSRNELVARAAKGLEEEVEQGVRIPVGKGFAGRIAAERKPLTLDRVDHTTVMNPILRSKGIRSLLGVPLLAHGDVLGVMHVGTLTPRRFDADDTELLQLVADRVALALQIRLSEQARLVTETFQRTFLPEALPHVPGLRIATRYLPAGSAVGIGGDWYDAFALPTGNFVLAIGDVAGHGLQAASTMGQLRNALRAHALAGADPTEIVTSLDAFLRYFAGGAMVTLLVGILEHDLATFRYVAAGHVPPLVIADGATAFVRADDADPPLGRAKVHAFRERTATLDRGTSLLLYTDGLVERRGESLDVGLGRLASLASDLDVERDPNEALLAIVSGALPRDPTDDAALMLVHRYAGIPDEFSIGMRAEARSLISIRRSLSAWLRGHDVPDDAAGDIVTAVSEACLNVVEHAYGPTGGVVRVVALRGTPVITVDVIDTGGWREAPGPERGRGFLLMRGLMDDVEIAEHDTGTVVTMRKEVP
ncbi:MAG TPA: SpoIIE family protein phosphatase [Actinomycetota bacterium]|nr:SpoIIE family protein phosphatase [Actinomycetota bacterium]